MAGSRMRSPLGRAIGLGSAKEGVDHWWAQRITALALVPLVVWFVISVVELAGWAGKGHRQGGGAGHPRAGVGAAGGVFVVRGGGAGGRGEKGPSPPTPRVAGPRRQPDEPRRSRGHY